MTLANGSSYNKNAGQSVNAWFLDNFGYPTYNKFHVRVGMHKVLLGVQTDNGYNSVWYPQFYPVSGPDINKFNYDAMVGVKNALGVV